MDIEGLEEEIFTKNIDLIKNTNRLSFVLETHQNKYKDPDKLFEALNSLIDYGYKIRFVELANFSNKKFLSKFLPSNKAIKSTKVEF